MYKRNKHSIILQVSFIFLIGILTTGLLTYLSQKYISKRTVTKQTENIASDIQKELKLAVMEYPAYRWLLRYWYKNADKMDIEYDVVYSRNTKTQERVVYWNTKYPDIPIKYAGASELEELPQEDQKLYAEITYSWLITRLNQIKRTYHIDYLFCVLTDDTYKNQFFLLSAADVGARRGTDYEEVYTLGVEKEVSASQEEAMRNARQYSSHLADAGKYVDYYAYFTTVDGHPVLFGLTFNLENLTTDIGFKTWRGTGIAMAHQLLLSLICLLAIGLYVLRPLKKIQRNIRLYKITKVSEPVIRNLSRTNLKNEIGELSQDVVELAREIDDYMGRIETITSEKERINTELTLASRIQNAMLPDTFPPFPDRNEFEIFAFMGPAKEIGGDFYDFFLIDEDHLCLSIADISGKGIPAALFMMAAKIILANNANTGKSPAQILESTNAVICSNNTAQMFMTVWIGILEISTGKIVAANAGHEYPVIRKPDGNFELLKDKHSFVIGGMEGVPYSEYEFVLEPETTLFLYTDGVPEATDKENKMFGTDRLLAALNEEADAAPHRLIENVKKSVDEFVREAEQFDDMTMLCLKYGDGRKKK